MGLKGFRAAENPLLFLRGLEFVALFSQGKFSVPIFGGNQTADGNWITVDVDTAANETLAVFEELYSLFSERVNSTSALKFLESVLLQDEGTGN